MIQGVVEFAANLRLVTLRECELFRERDIDGLKRVSTQARARRVPERELCRGDEGRKYRTNARWSVHRKAGSGSRSRFGRREPAEKAFVVFAAVMTVNGGPLCKVVNTPICQPPATQRGLACYVEPASDRVQSG